MRWWKVLACTLRQACVQACYLHVCTVLYIERVRLLTACQLAAGPWQRAGIRVPVQLPPPVWSLEESPGSCGGWMGRRLRCVFMCVLCVYNMRGWGAFAAREEVEAGGSREQGCAVETVRPRWPWLQSGRCCLREPMWICMSFPRSICLSACPSASWISVSVFLTVCLPLWAQKMPGRETEEGRERERRCSSLSVFFFFFFFSQQISH